MLIRRGVPAVVPQGSDDAVAIVGWAEGAGEVAALGDELAEALARDGHYLIPRQLAATFEHVGSHRMLMALHEAHTLSDFSAAVLGPIRDHDSSHRADLEHTLRTFLDLGGRFNESAAALHVHVNTLRNRLARIEELTGRDLSATDDRVDLYLALGAEGVHTDSGVSQD